MENVHGYDGTALHVAAAANNSDAVDSLLCMATAANKTDVLTSALNSSGHTAVQAAAAVPGAGCAEAVKALLISTSVDQTTPDADGRTPLELAVIANVPQVVAALLDDSECDEATTRATVFINYVAIITRQSKSL